MQVISYIREKTEDQLCFLITVIRAITGVLVNMAFSVGNGDDVMMMSAFLSLDQNDKVMESI